MFGSSLLNITKNKQAPAAASGGDSDKVGKDNCGVVSCASTTEGPEGGTAASSVLSSRNLPVSREDLQEISTQLRVATNDVQATYSQVFAQRDKLSDIQESLAGIEGVMSENASRRKFDDLVNKSIQEEMVSVGKENNKTAKASLHEAKLAKEAAEDMKGSMRTLVADNNSANKKVLSLADDFMKQTGAISAQLSGVEGNITSHLGRQDTKLDELLLGMNELISLGKGQEARNQRKDSESLKVRMARHFGANNHKK